MTSVDVALVGCCAAKASSPRAARELYLSTLFSKARAFAERPPFVAWSIVSAGVGLVAPDEIVAPYDRKISDLDADAREAWGERIVDDLVVAYPGIGTGDVRLWLLFGESYDRAIPWRRLAPIEIVRPLRGLQVGERLRWFNRAADGAPRFQVPMRFAS